MGKPTMGKTITARRLVTGKGEIEYPRIHVDGDGIIVSIEAGEATDDETTLTSSFLDIHFHGAMGHDVMQASVAEFCEIGRFLASRGVGQYLATTVTAPVEATLRALDRIAGAIEAGGSHAGEGRAKAVGIHLEGPFISHAKRGVHPPEEILPPDIALFDRFQEAARGHLRLMTVAPEMPGALELIEHATARGVRVSLGHTNALASEARAGIAKGATSATHLFNAMRALDHREPGVLGVVLSHAEMFAELICDGIHVAPELVRIFLSCKGLEKAILVTDGMSATGMGDGTYKLGNFDVEVRDGRATARGVLAGSVLTLDQAVTNFARFTGTPFAEVTRAAARNPAKMLGLEDRFAIAPGRPANLNRFAADGTLMETMLHGVPVGAPVATA
jgi:N-acetylglucosamine-6-phosphate deacetylase